MLSLVVFLFFFFAKSRKLRFLYKESQKIDFGRNRMWDDLTLDGEASSCKVIIVANVARFFKNKLKEITMFMMN